MFNYYLDSYKFKEGDGELTTHDLRWQHNPKEKCTMYSISKGMLFCHQLNNEIIN